MPANNSKSSKAAAFIFQANDSFLKVIKYLPSGIAKAGLCDIHCEPLPAQISAVDLAEKISHAFHKLGYNNNPVIVSLPRSQATCIYLKVPSQNTHEIEKIILLQAGRHLPYPESDLVTGFEIVSAEPGGYSGVNQIVVHKDVLEKYVPAFKKLKISAPQIILNSYGLSNFYIRSGKQRGPVLIIDIDSAQVELVISIEGKMFFSRSLRLVKDKPGWEDAFMAETNKTIDAFIKETGKSRPRSIAFTGNTKEDKELAGLFTRHFSLPVELLDCNVAVHQDGVSFSGLIGLGSGKVNESLNLLTHSLKQESAKTKTHNELRKIIFLGCGIAVILGLAAIKDIDNKTKKLAMLKTELSKFADDAKTLETLSRRLEFLENRLNGKPAVLDVLYEVSRAVPENVSLTNFSYGEDSKLVLRGQARELSQVFTFMSRLEKIPLLKSFRLKVKYATKRKTQAGETVDFEISS